MFRFSRFSKIFEVLQDFLRFKQFCGIFQGLVGRLFSESVSRPAERGGRGALCPRASGSKGPSNSRILTTGNALKWVLSQCKGGNRKIFCSLRSQGGLDSRFCPWASKSSRRPCLYHLNCIEKKPGWQAVLRTCFDVDGCNEELCKLFESRSTTTTRNKRRPLSDLILD